MAASSVWSWNLKEEPASPLRLSEQEEWYNTSDNVAVEVVVDEAKQSRGEAASKLLQDLDQWLKDEDPFPQWMENTMEFQMFEDLPLPLAPMNSQDVVTPLKPSAPLVPLTQATTLTPPPITNLDKVTLAPPTSATATVNTVKVSASPAFSKVEVVAVKPLHTQNYITLNPVQYVSQSSPGSPDYTTPTGLDEFNYAFTPLDTLTPPESPERKELEEVPQAQEVMVIQQLQPHELDELVNLRAECWVKSPEASFSSSSSSHEDNESVASPYSASSCSDPDWAAETSFEVKTHKRRRTITTKPYLKPPPEEKKLRKKEQNKNAATRYRLKKKQEQDELFDEEKHLQQRNEKLKGELTEVQKEIKYLKNLMRDMLQAKGFTK